jgi:hypothetical protein
VRQEREGELGGVYQQTDLGPGDSSEYSRSLDGIQRIYGDKIVQTRE